MNVTILLFPTVKLLHNSILQLQVKGWLNLMRKYFLSCILMRHECFQEWTFFIVHSDERDGALDIDVAPNTDVTSFSRSHSLSSQHSPPSFLFVSTTTIGMVGQRGKFIYRYLREMFNSKWENYLNLGSFVFYFMKIQETSNLKHL